MQRVGRAIWRRKGWLAGLTIAAGYGWMALRGPQGVDVLIEKRREIRELQQRNADMAQENERLKNRIGRLAGSSSEQEMEIRKQLKLQHPGETTFILQEGSKPADSDTPKAVEPQP